jgi:hypothetical protein
LQEVRLQPHRQHSRNLPRMRNPMSVVDKYYLAMRARELLIVGAKFGVTVIASLTLAYMACVACLMILGHGSTEIVRSGYAYKSGLVWAVFLVPGLVIVLLIFVRRSVLLHSILVLISALSITSSIALHNSWNALAKAIPVSGTAIAAVAVYVNRKRSIPTDCCQHCAYRLTGNTSGICPECGTPCLTPAEGG